MHWHRDIELPEVDLIVVPGGFTYGDYLRTGALAAHSPVMRAVKERSEAGVRILGICNGFQILTETGLLPGVLMRNAGLRFVCKDVHLRCENGSTPFTGLLREGDVLRIPIAHGEGNYFADRKTFNAIEQNGQIAFRYCDEIGQVTEDANPNGSMGNVAGVFNDRKSVLGMMPHPERLADPMLGGTDGELIFASLVEALS